MVIDVIIFVILLRLLVFNVEEVVIFVMISLYVDKKIYDKILI